MKTLLKVLGLLLALLVAIALLVPMFISMDDITQTIADQVEATTGRTLAVDGEKSLTVFPSLALQLEQVRFSNSAGSSRPDMATIESLDVHIPWLSLLSGELKVEKFVINNPDILLEIDAAGNANWDIMPTAEPAPDRREGEAPSLPAGFDISLGELAIYGGRVRLLNHQAGSEQLVEELDLVIALPSLQEDLALKGTVTWMGEVLELSVALTTPAGLLAGKPFDLELTLDSRLLTMVYRGNISDGGARVTGSLELAGDSLQELAAWQEVALEGGDHAFNRFALSGDMVFAADVLDISGLEARLDALEIKGSSTLSSTDPPDIRANLDLGMLDLNPYLPPEAAGEATPSAGTGAPAQAVEWDDTPIDLSALKSLNAQIALRSSGLRARDIKLGENELLLQVKAGKLDLGLEKFSAYQGSGTGSVTVDARRTPYSVTTDFSLSGISAQPLLTDVVGFDKLLGGGQLQWQLKSRGISQKDFISALGGKLDFKFSDGAIKGVNIAALVRSAQDLIKGDASGLGLTTGFDEAEQTDFSELGGTLVFTNGVGRNDDLAMASPLLRVSGKGDVDLPKAKIDYRLTARLVSTIEGQAATGKAKGVAIPVRIKGPFHKVKIEPDVSQAAEEKVMDTIKDELFKRFGKKP
jgi:AsmA protein